MATTKEFKTIIAYWGKTEVKAGEVPFKKIRLLDMSSSFNRGQNGMIGEVLRKSLKDNVELVGQLKFKGKKIEDYSTKELKDFIEDKRNYVGGSIIHRYLSKVRNYRKEGEE